MKVLLGIILVISLGCSLSVAKESGKQKGLEVELPDIVLNETAPSSEGDSTAEKTEVKDGEKEKVSAPATDSKDQEASGTTAVETIVSKPSYLTKVQNVLRRILEILGLAPQKRKSRKMMHPDDNLDNLQYVEEVRTTVGALLGRKECLKRAACGAGSYLRSVKGKEVLIVLLEKVAPDSWADSVNHIKEAAIYKDDCDYKCLDD